MNLCQESSGWPKRDEAVVGHVQGSKQGTERQSAADGFWEEDKSRAGRHKTTTQEVTGTFTQILAYNG